jgi:hypothetical protein
MLASDRIGLIKRISHQLENEDRTDIDLTLRQFGLPTTNQWEGSNKYAYCVHMIEESDDAKLSALGDHLFGTQTDGNVEVEKKLPWKGGAFRLLMSHVSIHKVLVSEIKASLTGKGIDSFVAHEDIEPTKEWLEQIQLALDTCDALVAFLTDDFHESKWTDHEIGYSVARRVLIIPIRLELDPYGFISRYQALTPRTKDPSKIAESVFEVLCGHALTERRIAEGLVSQFSNSDSFADAKVNVRLLDKIRNWTPELLREVEQAADKNYQIKQSFGVPEKVRFILSSHQK